jgi:hypothetical protein
VADGLLAVDAPRYDGRRARRAQGPSEAVGVVALVDDEAAEAAELGGEQIDGADVGDVARRQREGDRAAEEVAKRVDLARPAAARDADGLRLGPPLAPWAERCALT